jgi:mono/diheme cytochrome c family protein
MTFGQGKSAKLILLTLFLVMLLAACGGGGDEPADTNGGSGGQTSSNDSQANSPEVQAGDPAKGASLYTSSCSSCHGPDATGVEGLGKDMTTSDFIAGLSDAELLEFVKTGRPVGDPLNTTGVDMPPKGGNPALSDAQILDIIAHIRTLQQ